MPRRRSFQASNCHKSRLTIKSTRCAISTGIVCYEFSSVSTKRLSKVRVSQDGQAAAVNYLRNANGQRTFKSEPKADQYQPNEAELGLDFVTWLKKNFSWLFAQAQTDASIGTAYTFADGELPSWAVLGEYDNGSAAGKGRTEYIWLPTEGNSENAIPVGIYRNGKFFATHTDHLGTTRLMTNEQNAAVWQCPYSGFGNNKPTGVLKATPNPRAAMTNSPVLLRATGATEMNLRFPGQYADDETGQFYNYFRNYQPNQGRYTQGDPIGLDGGLNPFLYTEANSLSFTDPEGLQRRPGGAPVIPLFPRMGQTLPPANPQVGTTRAPIEVRPGTNLPGEVNGRPFSGHAFDRMQGRSRPPSAVIDALLSGRQNPGSRPNTTQHYDPVNNITVVTNSTTGNVITVRNGPPSNTCQ